LIGAPQRHEGRLAVGGYRDTHRGHVLGTKSLRLKLHRGDDFVGGCIDDAHRTTQLIADPQLFPVRAEIEHFQISDKPPRAAAIR
jgi:hypothetical protein